MKEIPSEIVTEEQLQRFERRKNRRRGAYGAYGGSAKSSALHETLINLATARHDLIVDAEPCQSCNISAAELIQLENELVADGFPSLGIRESLGLPKDFDPMKLPPPVHKLGPVKDMSEALFENSGGSLNKWGYYPFKTVAGVTQNEAGFNKWYDGQDANGKAYIDKWYNYISTHITNKGAIPPKWQCYRTGGSWAGNCGGDALSTYRGFYGKDFPSKSQAAHPFNVPPPTWWGAMPRTLELIWELKQRGIVGGNLTVISALRNPWHNCAVGSSPKSAHTKAGALDISGGWVNVNKMAKFWKEQGPSYRMGFGFYGAIPSRGNYYGSWHIDTFVNGHREWGPNRRSNTAVLHKTPHEDYGELPSGVKPTPKSMAPGPNGEMPVAGDYTGSDASGSSSGSSSSVPQTARKPTFTGAPSVCKNLPVDAKVKEAFELAFKQLYPEGKVDFGPVPTSQPPLGQYTPPPASPGSPGYSQVPPTAGGTGNTSTGQPGKHKLSVGDSFSEGARDHMPGVTKHYGKWGKNPEYILKNFVKKIPDDILNGAEVFLSTGTANAMGNTGMRDEITAQIQYMFDKGACSITVAGVYPESKTSAGVDKAGSAKSNQMVKEIVESFASKGKRIRWTGPVDAKYIGSDKLHPTAAWYKLPEVAFRGC